jgi:hypothetical protein
MALFITLRWKGKFLSEYANYIHRLSSGQAGKLSPVERKKPATIRRRLAAAAQTLGVNLVIKRSGQDIYFWSEDRGDEQPRTKRSYTRRNRRGRAGDYFPPQPFIEPELSEQGVREEEYPELRQTEQVVTDAMRRVDSE